MIEDKYSAGQYTGMLFMIMLIERNNGIDVELMDGIKKRCTEKLSVHLDKPEEDVLLMVEKLIAEKL